MSHLLSILLLLIFGFNSIRSQNGIPTSEESIEELVSSGVSENAAAGIVKFDKRLQEPFELEKTDPVGAKELEQELHKQFETFIDSLNENDQEAYQKFIKAKNSQF